MFRIVLNAKSLLGVSFILLILQQDSAFAKIN